MAKHPQLPTPIRQFKRGFSRNDKIMFCLLLINLGTLACVSYPFWARFL